MLVLETVAKVRRAYFVQKKSIKAICRELRVSRKVVRKVLRSEATEFHYERGEQPRIGPWQDRLDRILASNDCKARDIAAPVTACSASCGAGRQPNPAPPSPKPLFRLPLHLVKCASSTGATSRSSLAALCKPSKSPISG